MGQERLQIGAGITNRCRRLNNLIFNPKNKNIAFFTNAPLFPGNIQLVCNMRLCSLMKFLKMGRLKNMIQEDEALAEEVRRCECFFGKSCEAYKEKYRKEKT